MTDIHPQPARRAPGAGALLWIGLLVVLVAAAALSFDALRDLAEGVSIPERLAPLLPIAIDVGAAVSCATWLSRRVDNHTAAYARRMTFGLLALTVVGNAAQVGMHANGIAPPWWAAVVVGAIPPGVAGAVVHLIVLVSRTGPGPAAGAPRTVVDDAVREQAKRLIAGGSGRPRIAAALGLTDHQARRLVREIHQLPLPPDNDVPVLPATTAEKRTDHVDDVPSSYPSSVDAATPDRSRPKDKGGSGGRRERQARAHPQAAREG